MSTGDRYPTPPSEKPSSFPTPEEMRACANEQERPFVPEIKGELRRRVFDYARKRGRSAAGAVRWLLQQQLTKEGF